MILPKQVNMVLPLLSFTFASSCLAILGYGVMLAPKPPEEPTAAD